MDEEQIRFYSDKEPWKFAKAKVMGQMQKRCEDKRLQKQYSAHDKKLM